MRDVRGLAPWSGLRRTAGLACLCLVSLCLAAGDGRAEAGAPPYPAEPLQSSGDVNLRFFAAELYDILCLSHIFTAEVLSVAPRASLAAGNPVTEVRVQILKRYHTPGLGDCDPFEQYPPLEPISGLAQHEFEGDRATLRFLGGLLGSGPYEKLVTPPRGPYFFPGQQLFFIVGESQRRPIALEFDPSDGRLFDPADGSRVLLLDPLAITVGPAEAIEPAAQIFASEAERVYRSDAEIGVFGLTLEDDFGFGLAQQVEAVLLLRPGPTDPPSDGGSGGGRPDGGFWGAQILIRGAEDGSSASSYPGRRPWRTWRPELPRGPGARPGS